MQKVQFKVHTATTGEDEWIDAAADDLVVRYVDAFCIPGYGTSNYDGASGCAKAVLRQRGQLCIAEFLLKASEPRANAVVLEEQYVRASATTPNYVEILPQSHATNVGMLRNALRHASQAMNLDLDLPVYTFGGQGASVSYLPSVTDACTGAIPPDGSSPTGDGLYKPNPVMAITPEATLADLTKETIIRAYSVGRRAASLAVENILAVSDAERSSAVSAVVASRRGWIERDLSRLAAAQLLVSGANPDGYLTNPNLTEPGQFPTGFCPGNPLSAQAQRAVDLWRAAAPPPRWLLDATRTTTSLLHGPATDASFAGGSVKERLADAIGDSALLTTKDLPRHFGLDIQDFEEARQYLVGEIMAFGRDLDATMAPDADVYSHYLPYTALKVTAQDPPDAFYVALAVGQGDDGASYIASRDTYDMSLGTFREFARLAATQFLQKPNNVGISLAQAGSFKQAGAMLEQQVISEVPGRISLYAAPLVANSAQILIRYASYVDLGQYPDFRVIKGDRGMKCALEGTIEGKRCTDDDINNATLGSLFEYTPVPGDTPDICINAAQCLQYQTTGPTGASLLSEKARVYVVGRPGGGSTGSGPAGYKLVAAMELRGPTGTYTEIPANSVDYKEAARILRPSKQWCNHPRQPCSGGSFDERLPLEDELAGDGDGVESSWKRYLALAKQATEESDALGSAFVDAALRVDENAFSGSIRQEQQRQSLNAAMEKLQDTCGTAVDAQKLLDLLAGAPDSACNSTADCKGSAQICKSNKCTMGVRACSETLPCPSSGMCVSNVCTPDLNRLSGTAQSSTDPDLLRIANCLQGGNYDFVAIGNAPLCVDTGPGKAYCSGGSTPEYPCPRTADMVNGKAFCEYGATVDKDLDGTSSTDLLGLFHASVNTGNPTEICDDIASFRDRSILPENVGATMEKIKQSKVFLPEFVQDIAKRLGFEARLGSFAAVTLGGTPIIYTGDPIMGPHVGVWPCVAESVVGVTPDPSLSLKAQHVDCKNAENVNQRGLMNDRLMRAVILARFVGGNPNGKGLYVPGYGINLDLKATATNSTTVLDVGAVSQYDMDLQTMIGKTPARVYVTSDSIAAGTTAYTTLWGGAATAIPLQWLFNGQPRNFAVGNFTDDINFSFVSGQWSNVMEVADAIKAGIYSVGDGTGIIGVGDAAGQNRKGEVLELTEIWPGTKKWARSFPLVSQEQWFEGLSTQIKPASSDSPAYGWFAANLANLPSSLPLTDLPGFIHMIPGGYQALSYYDSVAFTSTNMFDALELICLARAVDAHGVKPDMNNPPSVKSPAELPVAKAYLDETAKRIEDWASHFVLANFPKAAADFLREKSKAGVVPKLGGTYATAMTSLRANLVEFAQVAPLMAYELRQLGTAVNQARIATSETDLKMELNQLNFESTLANSAAACAGAMASTEAKLTFAASAAVTCVNAIVQSIIAAKELNIQNEIGDLEKSAALNSFQEQLNTHAQALQSYATRISKSLEELDGSVAELERQRLVAQRALTEAIQIASFMPTNAENIGATLARQKETAKVRYEQAFKNAQRMSDLAKRGIEQRLGVLLADMHDDLPLVDAPRSWEGTVCDRSGINWDNLRSTNKDVPDNYADAFLGEYVSKLERVVESYRLEHSFHEGNDTAVISLRDDVLNVRAPCNVKTRNLLEHSSDLNAAADAEGRHGWAATGCAPRVDGTTGATLAPQNCMSVRQADGWSFDNMATDTGGLRPFLIFGGKASRTACTANQCDYIPVSAWTQKVPLSAGTYRLSYFTLDGTQLGGAAKAITATASVSLPSTGAMSLNWIPGDIVSGRSGPYPLNWQRMFAIIRLTSAIEVTVQLRPYNMGVFGPEGVVAAPMLEKIDSIAGLTDAQLAPDSIVTNGDGTSLSLKSCEDTDGFEFRANGWRRGQLPLCPDGFNGNCDKNSAQLYDFWEIPFSINQSDIESGRILKKAGFALGNFNYRIESIALNFVGTGIRDCSKSSSPSTCYSGGFVPYSLDHVGPYFVRNHMGGRFDAKLFTGHIQTARGLSAERYLTNPLSSADEQLLKDYIRTELQGRPLDGNFVIRLWDNPDVDFGAIKDIQVVLKYRYWTRFD